MLKEFKAFISRGNVLDLAVGLILATYFGAIVKSFVDDILMPPIGMLIGGVDFAELKMKISEKAAEDGTITEVFINYGSFVNTIITFVIVAFAIFMIVKAYNRMQAKKEEAPAAPPAPSKEEQLLTEIRDLLKK
ncbi:MAG: large-conductance mechanosensitive channel protein MscL [Flavobacteriales bacterium]